MGIIISSIGMIFISMALCEMGYGLKTPVWWFFIIGFATYALGWRLLK